MKLKIKDFVERYFCEREGKGLDSGGEGEPQPQSDKGEPMTDFDRQVEGEQLRWRADNVACEDHGEQNGRVLPWILPKEMWQEGLYPGIRSGSDNSLPDYLVESGVDKHDGVHNLKSSWVLCVNLYFPFRRDMDMLASFLKSNVYDRVASVEAVELEFAEEPPLDPVTLLGEPGGKKKGRNQTSPDVAFIVGTVDGGKGLILTENKYTEHSFYECSGRNAKYGNPDNRRCLNLDLVLSDLDGNCYQLCWEDKKRKNRRYWEYLTISERGRQVLTRCPGAVSGSQLFRQQALAEALGGSGKYEFVISCVAFDERNSTLRHCLSATGIDDFTEGWAEIFEGKTQFATFTHQQWVEWVRNHDAQRRWEGWLEYIENRYGY